MNSDEIFTEKDLDTVLDNGFKDSQEFGRWFLSKTKFSKLKAKYVWSRSDNPWGRFTFGVMNSTSGEEELITRDSETDVLVVFEDGAGSRFAFHIENKLANGKFTEYQPEFYSKRAEAWKNNKKFGDYVDYECILVAPIKFYEANFESAQQFDKFISYEEIGILLPEFSSYLMSYNEPKSQTP